MVNWLQFGNIPIDYSVLTDVLTGYKSRRDKIAALEKRGTLIRLKKGMYVVSPDMSRHQLSKELIANHLYGPSYVSLESALSFYSLIPERVHTVRSVSTKRAKYFSNALGKFDYQTVPPGYYAIGINQQETTEGHTFLIASPEKAISDMILVTPGLRLQSVKAVQTYLEEDMRMDLSVLANYNTDIIRQCIEVGKKKTSLTNLLKLLEQ